jgi:hypothetical protein
MHSCFLFPADFDAAQFSRQMDAVFGEASSSSNRPERSPDYSASPIFFDPLSPPDSDFPAAYKASDPSFLTFETKSARAQGGGQDQFTALKAKWDQIIAEDQTRAEALVSDTRRKLMRAPMLTKEPEVVITVRDVHSPPTVTRVESVAAAPVVVAEPDSSQVRRSMRRRGTPDQTSVAPPKPAELEKVETKPAKVEKPLSVAPKPEVEAPKLPIVEPAPQEIAAPARMARPAQGLAGGLAARMAALGNIPVPGQARPEAAEPEEAQVARPAPQVVRCARKKGAARPPGRALES